MKLRIVILIWILIFFTLSIVLADSTGILVKVKGKGSKFVGSSVGGARITIKDARSGKFLAEGKTEGSTGNTDLIMRTPRKEGVPISDDTAANFSTTLDIDKPAYVEITASGPLAYPDSVQSISITQWVLPGKDITENDGLLLELPGLIVDVIHAPENIYLSDIEDSSTMSVQVRINMICGCPIMPGGIWDSDKFTMKALIRQDGNLVDEVPLSYQGQPGLFSAPLNIYSTGSYKVTVYAFDTRNGNSGIDSTDLFVEE